jgi:DNA-binding PadR family transcriptional regulator
MPQFKREIKKHSTKNLFDYIVFRLLKQRPMPAGQIIGHICQNFGVSFELNSVTPVLNYFEAEGVIMGKWDLVDGRPRKISQLTPIGSRITNSIENEFNDRYQKITIDSTALNYKNKS